MKYRALLVWTVTLMTCLIIWGSGPRQSSAAPTNGGTTSRVSVDSAGAQGDGASVAPAVSADGRFVAFASEAGNLVPNDTNRVADIFVHDRQTGQTSRVSVSSSGVEGNGMSSVPAISADGRVVAFASQADNLVPNDTNINCTVCGTDVFVHDRQTGQTSRVSVSSTGAEATGISENPAISADGRFVAFESWAANLVPGDTTDKWTDIFVHDRQTGETSRVSIGIGGQEANDHSKYAALSADGRFVVFQSWARNLVPGEITWMPEIFVYDRQTKQTSLVSVSSNGARGDGASSAPAISADGRYVAFASEAGNLIPGDTNIVKDVFVHDRQTKETSRVSVDGNGEQGYNWSSDPSISADGRYVAFESWAGSLVPGDTNNVGDVFVRDRLNGITSHISIRAGGGQEHGWSHSASISADGRYVAFESRADDIVPNDTNGVTDIFVHDLGEPVPPVETIMLYVPVFLNK